MSHDAAPSWIDRRVRAAMHSELDALRQAFDSLRSQVDSDRGAQQAELSVLRETVARLQSGVSEIRGIIAGLVTETQERAERVQGEFHALRDELATGDARTAESLTERDQRIEAVRVRLEGVMAQHRWDMEQLRQSLAVVAEQLPLTD